MSLKKYAALCGALALVAGSASTLASTVPVPTGTVDVPTMSMSVNFDYTGMSTVTDNPDGTSQNFMGSNTNSVWDYAWNFDADADPFVDATLTFQNLTGMTQSFLVNISLPVTPAFSPGVKTGSLGYSFSDTGGAAGASVSNVNWDGLIDGSSAMQLFASSLSCGGAGCSLSLSTITDGPTLHPAGVSSDIGILLGFDLSAGDTVTFTTRFEVNPIPVPAAAWLFGSGLLGIIGIARRRQAA